jgi:hypothetical protein
MPNRFPKYRHLSGMQCRSIFPLESTELYSRAGYLEWYNSDPDSSGSGFVALKQQKYENKVYRYVFKIIFGWRKGSKCYCIFDFVLSQNQVHNMCPAGVTPPEKFLILPDSDRLHCSAVSYSYSVPYGTGSYRYRTLSVWYLVPKQKLSRYLLKKHGFLKFCSHCCIKNSPNSL